MDRIDLHINLPPVAVDKLTQDSKSEPSKSVRKRVQNARDRQTYRFRKTKITCNSDLGSKDVKEFINLSSECQSLLRQAAATLHLSARTYYHSIKVARTIADINGDKDISVTHLAEALQYRPKEDTEINL